MKIILSKFSGRYGGQNKKLRPKAWDEAVLRGTTQIARENPMPLEPCNAGTRRSLCGAPGRRPKQFPGRLSAGGVLSEEKRGFGETLLSR